MGYKNNNAGESRATAEAAKQRPVDEIRFGACKVVVWSNETKNGTMLNFVPVRIYKTDDGEWKETQSLGAGDLLAMAEALREAWRKATIPD